jgi:16S rRNA (cytosine1402-N4)-methyltransferase
MELPHTPVMVEEVVRYLSSSEKEGIYVDCTLGSGGHTEAILKKGAGRVIGIDQDEEQVNRARERLKGYGHRIALIHNNFKNLKEIFQKLKISEVKGILFDLGVSSEHLQEPSRGFSFLASGPLDMRMDRRSKITASDLVNNLPFPALKELIFEFGQEHWASKIAKFIVKERKHRPFQTTKELADLIKRVIPYSKVRRKIHPATRTFQALRIAVNNELEILKESLPRAIDILSKKGRILVISFHSLEDGITKRVFREEAKLGRIKILTKKPLLPSLREVVFNPRARSAKLRVAEKRV